MQKLSGIDAVFLAVERSENPMNVMGTLVLEPTGGRREFLEAVLPEYLNQRLPRLLPLGRRLVELPFDLGLPIWLEDGDFRCADHIQNIRLPAPGSERQLAAFVASQSRLPLHRSRPLWELSIVEGLAQRRVALVFKFHHAAVDGISCAAMLAQLLDLAPAPEAARGRDEGTEIGAQPPTTSLLANEIAQWPRRIRLVRSIVDGGARAATESFRARVRGGAPPNRAQPFTAIRTPFNRELSSRRTVATSRAPRSDIRFVKRVFGTTSNDVILAACTEALRNYLDGHGGIPEGPLIAAIPCSTRSRDGASSYGNQISAFLVRLPVQLEDRVDRLLAIRSETRIARAERGRVAGSPLQDWAELAPQRLLKWGGALLGDSRFLRRTRPLCNLVVSNLPGPPVALTLAGARVKAVHPHGPLMPGVGLNLTAMSHGDTVDFGLLACSRAVPDAADLALGLGSAVGALKKRAIKEANADLREAS